MDGDVVTKSTMPTMQEIRSLEARLDELAEQHAQLRAMLRTAKELAKQR